MQVPGVKQLFLAASASIVVLSSLASAVQAEPPANHPADGDPGVGAAAAKEHRAPALSQVETEPEPLPVPEPPSEPDPEPDPELDPEPDPEPEAKKPRPRRNYAGLGGNVGLRGDQTALGDGGIVFVSKVGFSDRLSLHNQTVFGKQTAGITALTVDFPIRRGDRVVVAPFIGGGAATRLDNGLHIDPALVGGADIPLSKDFMGTVRVNTSFKDETEVGLTLGIGYNFRSFFR